MPSWGGHTGVSTQQRSRSTPEILGLDPHRFTGGDRCRLHGSARERRGVLREAAAAVAAGSRPPGVCFGHYPDGHPHLINCGYLDDDTAIARVYACGDVFLNPVTIEAFGQTLLEASACGCIPISLKGTGLRALCIINAPACSAISLRASCRREAAAASTRTTAIDASQSHRNGSASVFLHQQANIWTEQLVSAWATPTHADRSAAKPVTAPRLSIVTTTLNCAEPLNATAKTLAMQCDQNFEWVVQDGGSNDATASVAAACGVNLSWQCSSDQGIYDALNQAIQRCRGDWILVLQAGDWLAGPHALHDLFDSIDANQHDILIAASTNSASKGCCISAIPPTPPPNWLT